MVVGGREERLSCGRCGTVSLVKEHREVDLVDLPAFGQRVTSRVIRTRWCCSVFRCGTGSWMIEHREIAPAGQELTTRGDGGRQARSAATPAAGQRSPSRWARAGTPSTTSWSPTAKRSPTPVLIGPGWWRRCRSMRRCSRVRAVGGSSSGRPGSVMLGRVSCSRSSRAGTPPPQLSGSPGRTAVVGGHPLGGDGSVGAVPSDVRHDAS